MNIFEVWAITIWSHLEGRSCVRNTEILYSEHYSAHYTPKNASYGKMIYMDCLRLVETIDFDIKIISIRDHMQKLEPAQRDPPVSKNMTPGTRHIRGYVWCAAWIISCLARAIWPSRWPLMKKRSAWKLFVSLKRSRLLLGSFPSEIVYHLKSYPQNAASLNRTVLESSDKTNPNLTRVLDVNPSLFLAREVQPPLIYLRGDDRLNNTQSIKSSTTFFFFFFLPNPSSSSSLFFVCSSCCRAANLEALGAIRST